MNPQYLHSLSVNSPTVIAVDVFFNVSVYICVFSEEDQFPIGCIWSTGFNDSCMELWVNKRPVVISLYRTVTCMETRPAFHLYFKTNT